MKVRLIAALLAVSAAVAVNAADVQTVLAPDSTLYTISASPDRNVLELSLRKGDVRETLVVPGTDDEAGETDPRLVYDSRNATLFLMWHRAGEDADQILLASLNSSREWSEPVVIASGTGRRTGLHFVLSHARGTEVDEPDTTLLYGAWWTLDGGSTAELALLAWERGQLVSTSVDRLEELANAPVVEGGTEVEDTGAALHPPMSIKRIDEGVEVVFGRDASTALTRTRIDPRKVVGDARMWRPSGRSGQTTGPARLVAANTAPVQAFTSEAKIVLYTPDAKFRFIVFENGAWQPIRMIALDETLSPAEVVEQLRKTVAEMDTAAVTEEE